LPDRIIEGEDQSAKAQEKLAARTANPFNDAQSLREEGLQFPSLNTALLLTERVMLP